VVQSIINGLMIGGIYALVAVGLTLIFGVMGIVNFAQGEFLMAGMFITWLLNKWLHLGIYPLFFVVTPIMLLFGWGIFRTLITRVIGKSDIYQILLTLGLSIFLVNGAIMIWGPDYQSIPNTVKQAAWHLGPFMIPVARVVAFLVAAALVVVLEIIINRTEMGRAMRATAESAEIATLLGINPRKTFALAFAIGIALAGAAGVLISPLFYVYPQVGGLFNNTAFVVVVLGGMGDVTGAMFGGLLIGVVEALSATFISLDLAQLGVYVIFILVLFLRPNGLFGRSGS
jgi:branched-chain amino acid transport system permease protein